MAVLGREHLYILCGMELFELRYFLAVASDENLHRAAEKLHVSPGSLSKAIGRLEDELGLKLFARDGRNISLTDAGRLLERRASEICQMEESFKLELLGAKGTIQAVIAGPETLLSEAGLTLAAKIKERYPNAIVEFHAKEDLETIDEVLRGEAHLGLITHDVPAGLKAKTLSETTFVTCVGKGHPLHGTKKVIPITEVLKHAFVVPSHPLLGKVGLRQSYDGWRDDKFPRRVEYLASSLKLLEELVSRGRAIAYLPDYVAARIPVTPLKISGCPYHCKQTIKTITRPSPTLGWLNQLL